MRLRIIWTGKTRDSRLRALIDDYAERLSHFVRYEVSELREQRSANRKAGIDKESRGITDALRPGAQTVLLHPDGVEWTSQQLAAQVQGWESSGIKEVAFIVGGPQGVSPDVVSRVDKRSLSRLTLTHEMARVLLFEQLYRAYTIIHGLPYQK